MPHETRHNGLETLAAETKQESQPPALKYENPVVFEHFKERWEIIFSRIRVYFTFAFQEREFNSFIE